MKTSIIIPTYNEEKDIQKCMESLLVQSHKDFELIIVDDGSTDKTREIVKQLSSKNKRIKLILGKHGGPGASRNLGAKKAKGKVLVFVDSDMSFPKDFIQNLTKPILKGEVFGTQDGFQISSNPNNIWSKCWGWFQESKEEYEKRHSRFPEARKGHIFRAISKKKFNELGGFDPKLGYADDQTFYIKYGLMSYRVKGAWCYHKNPSSFKEVYKQSRWIGSSLNSSLLKIHFIKNLFPLFLLLVSPFAIPFISVKKCYLNRNFKVFFPWMILFMIARYFGTIHGMINKNYLKKNTR